MNIINFKIIVIVSIIVSIIVIIIFISFNKTKYSNPLDLEYLEKQINIGGFGYDSGYEILLDDYDNIYTIGSYSYMADTNEGWPISIQYCSSVDNGFLAKYNEYGVCVWFHSWPQRPSIGFGFGSWLDKNGILIDSIGYHDNLKEYNLINNSFVKLSENIYGIDVIKDNDTYYILNGNLIIYTNYEGEIIWSKELFKDNGLFNIDGGELEYYENNIIAAEQQLVLIDLNGDIKWSEMLPGTAKGIGIYEDNIIVGGTRIGQESEPNISNDYITESPGLFYAYLSKYDFNGNLKWQLVWKSILNGLSINDNGDIYCTGGFKGGSDFDPGPDIVNRVSAVNGGDRVYTMYIAKYNEDGIFQWVNVADIWSIGQGIQIDNDGNIWITGMANGDAVIAKILDAQ